ncbi:unnamed protein product [Bathycoccus prasinos]
MRVVLSYCAAHDPTIPGQVEDAGCSRFLSATTKVEKISANKRTLIDSGLPSINGRSMTIDFPAGALAEEIDVSITELQQQDIFGSQPGGFLGPILGSIVDLQPHGTEFSTCVTIELPYIYTDSYLNNALIALIRTLRWFLTPCTRTTAMVLVPQPRAFQVSA